MHSIWTCFAYRTIFFGVAQHNGFQTELIRAKDVFNTLSTTHAIHVLLHLTCNANEYAQNWRRNPSENMHKMAAITKKSCKEMKAGAELWSARCCATVNVLWGTMYRIVSSQFIHFYSQNVLTRLVNFVCRWRRSGKFEMRAPHFIDTLIRVKCVRPLAKGEHDFPGAGKSSFRVRDDSHLRGEGWRAKRDVRTLYLNWSGVMAPTADALFVMLSCASGRVKVALALLVLKHAN